MTQLVHHWAYSPRTLHLTTDIYHAGFVTVWFLRENGSARLEPPLSLHTQKGNTNTLVTLFHLRGKTGTWEVLMMFTVQRKTLTQRLWRDPIPVLLPIISCYDSFYITEGLEGIFHSPSTSHPFSLCLIISLLMASLPRLLILSQSYLPFNQKLQALLKS